MLTVGGVLFERQHAEILKQCSFDQLDFLGEGAQPFLIEAPQLTYREFHHIDSQLPPDKAAALNAPGLQKEELDSYINVYRYYPRYAEVEM